MCEELSIDKVKLFVDYLLNKYEYKYTFTKDDFKRKILKEKSNGESVFRKYDWPKNPIVLASGKNNNEIEVMAFGGCIGIINVVSDSGEFLDKEKINAFIKYLYENDKDLDKGLDDDCRRKVDNHGNKYWLPKDFMDDYLKDKEFPKNILENCPTPATFTNDNAKDLKKYLDLLICSAYVRFMHRTDNKMVDLSERSMQTIIARNNMDSVQNSNLVFIDTEFKILLEDEEGSDKKTPSVDLIVLDKDDKSFGLIEFKYQGKSMNENDGNSLTTHCKDFIQMMGEKKRTEILKKLIKYTNLLINLGVIKDYKVKQFVNDIDNLWYGFYFVENKGRWSQRNIEPQKNKPKIIKRMKIEDRIIVDCNKQIMCNDEFDKKFLKTIRFQNSDISNTVLSMTEMLHEVCLRHKKNHSDYYPYS